MIQSWHCDITHTSTTTDSEDCSVTASSSAPVSASCGSSSSSPCYNEITYYDYLIPQLWIIFLLAIISLGFFVRPFRKKPKASSYMTK